MKDKFMWLLLTLQVLGMVVYGVAQHWDAMGSALATCLWMLLYMSAKDRAEHAQGVIDQVMGRKQPEELF